jgi:hypothetical protein
MFHLLHNIAKSKYPHFHSSKTIKIQHIVVERERKHQKSFLLHPLVYKSGDTPQILPLDLILVTTNLPLLIFQNIVKLMTLPKSRKIIQVLPIIDNFVILGNLLKQLL